MADEAPVDAVAPWTIKAVPTEIRNKVITANEGPWRSLTWIKPRVAVGWLGPWIMRPARRIEALFTRPAPGGFNAGYMQSVQLP